MGVYVRKDSPYYWVLLERRGQSPLCQSTHVLRDARTAEGRKQQRHLAEAVYIARMNDLARKAHQLPATHTEPFDQFVGWYRTHVLPSRRGKDREEYALTLLEAFFGKDDLMSVTPDRVREYTTERLKTVAPGTVNREVGVLKSVMRAAVPKYFPVSPIKGLKWLRVVPRPKRLLLPDEESKLLASMTRPEDRAFYLVALDSLMRLSNVIDLRRDEDKGDHFALRDSKTGPYIAIISSRVRTALDALPKAGPYYFPHRRTGKTPAQRRSAVRVWLRRACERAGIPYGRTAQGMTFHTGTRATGATRMLQAGHDVRTVQEVGNWRDVRSMAGYLGTDRGRMRNAVESITPHLRATEHSQTKAVKSGRKAR